MTALRYRAVLFDLDGTLVDSYAALADAVNHARGAAGLGPTNEGSIRAMVGEGVDSLLQRALEVDDVDPRLREIFEARYDVVCCEQSRVLDEVEETLAALQQRGIPMAVCTNKPTSFSAKILDSLRIGHHFRAVVGPDLAGARKPDPRHVLYALATTGCAPTDALFVGDMPIDIEAARASGLAIAALATGSSPEEQLRNAEPDYLLDRFSQLIALVGGNEALA